jgi:ubiquinone/menaquinone biosynthesis C-methylase UbiE
MRWTSARLDQLFAERAAELAHGARWIFDIGSGNAKIPLAIGALAATTRICAIEMSAEMLAAGVRNRSRAGTDARRLLFLRAEAKRLPLPGACADLVTSNSLVHHVPDPRAVFREIARIVRPGGSILIRDLVRPESKEELAQLVGAPRRPVRVNCNGACFLIRFTPRSRYRKFATC